MIIDTISRRNIAGEMNTGAALAVGFVGDIVIRKSIGNVGAGDLRCYTDCPAIINIPNTPSKVIISRNIADR